jgi:hypothetical protein
MPGPDAKPPFLQYVDKDGQQVIVNRIDDVPAEYRGKAKPFDLDGSDEAAPEPGMRLPDFSMPDLAREAWHPPSFAAGAGAMAVAMVVVQVLRGPSLRAIVKTLFVGALVAGLGVAWMLVMQNGVRSQAGLPASMKPTQIFDDAKAARKRMEEQLRVQEKAFKSLE